MILNEHRFLIKEVDIIASKVQKSFLHPKTWSRKGDTSICSFLQFHLCRKAQLDKVKLKKKHFLQDQLMLFTHHREPAPAPR